MRMNRRAGILLPNAIKVYLRYGGDFYMTSYAKISYAVNGSSEFTLISSLSSSSPIILTGVTSIQFKTWTTTSDYAAEVGNTYGASDVCYASDSNQTVTSSSISITGDRSFYIRSRYKG